MISSLKDSSGARVMRSSLEAGTMVEYRHSVGE